MTTTDYQETRSRMDRWLVAHPEFLAAQGEPPITFEQIDRLRQAKIMLMASDAAEPAAVRQKLEAMRQRYDTLARIYFHARVSEMLGVPVPELERLRKGNELERAKYGELIETYDEYVRCAPALIHSPERELRKATAFAFSFFVFIAAFWLIIAAFVPK